MAFLPVIYPGFSWTNLKGKGAAGATIPRLGGEFFWRQFVTAADLGIDMAYVAMFDEVDEGTAIFKVSNNPADAGHVCYLRWTADGLVLAVDRRGVQSDSRRTRASGDAADQAVKLRVPDSRAIRFQIE